LELKGARISIRPVSWDDLPILCRWWNDPAIMREVRAEKFKPTLEQVQKSWLLWQNPDPKDFHLFVICLSGRAIGEIGYRYEDSEQQSASVDIKIGEPSLWGQGLGTEAVKLFVAYLFDRLNVQHIIAQPGDWNIRSIRLFEKCGFIEIRRERLPATDFFDGGIGVVMQRDRK
jgi:RimJ/RimL family protein N-acetyltransferase